MRYIKSFDIWAEDITLDRLRSLQPGQWIHAGDTGNKGIFLGIKPSGTTVVAWAGNLSMQRNRLDYIRSLRQYATA